MITFFVTLTGRFQSDGAASMAVNGLRTGEEWDRKLEPWPTSLFTRPTLSRLCVASSFVVFYVRRNHYGLLGTWEEKGAGIAQWLEHRTRD